MQNKSSPVSYFLCSTLPFVRHNPIKKDHYENYEGHHITHVFCATTFQHRTDSTQATCEKVTGICKAILHVIQKRILLTYFVSNIDCKTLQSSNLFAQFIYAIIVLLFHYIGIHFRSGHAASFRIISIASLHFTEMPVGILMTGSYWCRVTTARSALVHRLSNLSNLCSLRTRSKEKSVLAEEKVMGLIFIYGLQLEVVAKDAIFTVG
mmetsp:Transcript_1845/g.1755  ORF Transcript_1845/g.1755 Transcript_1845/m.1755 type:complete len:208 (+) Transcript_1845:237-860(+)